MDRKNVYGYDLRFFNIYAGAPRSGKTFRAQAFARHYRRHIGGVWVYNAGRDDDFAEFTYFEPLELVESAELLGVERKDYFHFMRRRSLMHFRVDGQVYNFEDFNAVCLRYPGLKMSEIVDNKTASHFWQSVMLYCSGSLMILDDAMTFTEGNFNTRLRAIFAKQNHAGKAANWVQSSFKGRGIDIIALYHHFDQIPKKVFSAATHLTQFRCVQKPEGLNIKNRTAETLMLDSYKYLLSANRFTAIETPLMGDNKFKSRLIQPAETLKLSSK